MELIDREALLLDVRGMNDGWRDPKPAYDVETLIKDQPTIEAVPLDKLCDWLAEKAVFFANDNDSDQEAWKETIKECVMEGERETD